MRRENTAIIARIELAVTYFFSPKITNMTLFLI